MNNDKLNKMFYRVMSKFERGENLQDIEKKSLLIFLLAKGIPKEVLLLVFPFSYEKLDFIKKMSEFLK